MCDASGPPMNGIRLENERRRFVNANTRNSTNSCSIIFLTAVAIDTPPGEMRTENITVYNVVWSPTLQPVVHLCSQGYVLIRIYWMRFSAQFIAVRVRFSCWFIQIDTSASLRRHDKCPATLIARKQIAMTNTTRRHWCCALEQNHSLWSLQIFSFCGWVASRSTGRNKTQHFKHFWVNKIIDLKRIDGDVCWAMCSLTQPLLRC